jgi:hypothetical protein
MYSNPSSGSERKECGEGEETSSIPQLSEYVDIQLF